MLKWIHSTEWVTEGDGGAYMPKNICVCVLLHGHKHLVMSMSNTIMKKWVIGSEAENTLGYLSVLLAASYTGSVPEKKCGTEANLHNQKTYQRMIPHPQYRHTSTFCNVSHHPHTRPVTLLSHACNCCIYFTQLTKEERPQLFSWHFSRWVSDFFILFFCLLTFPGGPSPPWDYDLVSNVWPELHLGNCLCINFFFLKFISLWRWVSIFSTRPPFDATLKDSPVKSC